MPPTSSFQVWAVYDVGHEHSTCVVVCTSKHLAEKQKQKFENKGSEELGHLCFRVERVNLLVHEGAHHIRQKMLGERNCS